MKTPLFLLVALFLAANADAADLKGNAKTGKTLSYTCTGCHGIAEYKNAYPSYRVPKLAGQHEKYLLAALHAYKKGERNHPTMKAQASSFSDQDIADIAAYLSSLKSSKQ
jgi:cytochrome c553